MEKRLSQAVGQMRRELGFHSVQSDLRQLLYGLPSNVPSSTNQIARCSFEESHPPFFGPKSSPLSYEVFHDELFSNFFNIAPIACYRPDLAFPAKVRHTKVQSELS